MPQGRGAPTTSANKSIRTLTECVHGRYARGATVPDGVQPSRLRESRARRRRDRALRALFAIGDSRTAEQDAGFGIRQIVDIALKALRRQRRSSWTEAGHQRSGAEAFWPRCYAHFLRNALAYQSEHINRFGE